MANIADYLRNILSARYGKDVRQSIHDAIHKCYEDGKAGATDLVAREQISYVADNVNKFTDEVTGKKYKMGVNNGLIYIQEVDR